MSNFAIFRLVSEVFPVQPTDTRGLNDYCVEFWYFIYGAGVQSFRLYYDDNQFTEQQLWSEKTDTGILLFSVLIILLVLVKL